MEIALQLYSIKEISAIDFRNAIAVAAQAGYDGVEFAGYYGLSAKEICEELKKNSLTGSGTHLQFSEIEKDLKGTLDFCKTAGIKSAVVPYIRFDTADLWVDFAKKMNEYGKAFREKGIIFGYHNHAFEFEKIGGKYAIEILLDNCQPENVCWEMDTHWVYKGGETPEIYAQKYSGRFPLIHAKDVGNDEGDTEIGTGKLNFPAIVKACGNVKTIIVEQEAYKIDMKESIKISCDNLKKLFR